jgi:hypothetical protein
MKLRGDLIWVMLAAIQSRTFFLLVCCLKNVKIRIYKTTILPVFMYGCETFCLTLREQHGLRVFENRVLRRIFGPKRDEVTGGWRKLHNEETNLIIMIRSMRMRWAGHVASIGLRGMHIGV